MKIISLTGGVGSGKSEVLKLLREEYGAEVIIADQVAHQLMEPGKKGYKRVAVTYTHLRPHETPEHHVCRHML